MAYVSNYDPEQQNQSQGPVTPGGASNTVHLSPNGGVGSVGGAGQPQPSQQGAGGQFASLNQYVNANQGAAQPLANTITSGIGQQYNNLQNQNQQTLSGISNQVNSGYTPQNQSILQQEAANPVSFASNPGNIASFQSQLNDQYTGPKSAESTGSYTQQLANVNNAINQGNAQVGTDTGRQQLLQQYEKTPTAGVTGLNSAILAQNPTAQGQIEQAYKPFSNLTSQLTQGAGNIDTSIGQAQSAAQNASNAANQQIQQQQQALNTNIGNEYNTAQQQYQNYVNQANAAGSAFQKGVLPTGYGVDPGLQAFLTNNVNPWLSQYASGVTPSYNFANVVPQFPTANAPTMNQSITGQDFATYNALNQLSPFSSPLSGLDASQAGTYQAPNLNGVTVNNKALAGDIEAGLNSATSNVNVGAQPYNQWLAIMAALNNYQGISNGGNLPNPGTSIPTIA